MKTSSHVDTISKILPLVLFLSAQHLQSSQAICYRCRNPSLNSSTPLTHRLSPPNFRMATFVPLTNIHPVLNYHNLTELYVKVLERFQSITILKQQMGKRIGEDVPAPHQHCFITERSTLNSSETNSSRFLDRLTDDLCMMVDLDEALNWTIQYEGRNHSNHFTPCLTSVKHSVEVIIQGLSNLTNVSTTDCGATNENGESSDSQDGAGSQNGGETTYNSNSLPDNKDQQAQDDSPTSDPFFDQERTPREARSVSTQEIISFVISSTESTPTNRPRPLYRRSTSPNEGDTETNCGAISTDNQQFTYLYEVWVGMLYLQNDLISMRDHHANY